MDIPRLTIDRAIGIFGLVLAIALVVLDNAGKLRGGWLYVWLFVAFVMTLFLAMGNSWVLDTRPKSKVWRAALMFGTTAVIFIGISLWIYPTSTEGEETTVGKASSGQNTVSFPSLSTYRDAQTAPPTPVQQTVGPTAPQPKPEKFAISKTPKVELTRIPTSTRTKVGTDSVVYGNISPGSTIGDRSVVVGATDNRGNTFIRGGTAVGYGAHADPTSVAIGANSGAAQQHPTYQQTCSDGSNCVGSNYGTVIGKVYGASRPAPPVTGLDIKPLDLVPATPAPVFSIDPATRTQEAMEWKEKVISGRVHQETPPGLVLSFHVAGTFQNPVFLIRCDRPCGGGRVLQYLDGNGSSVNEQYSVDPKFPNTILLTLQGMSFLNSNVLLVVEVYSKDKNPLKSATVESYIQ